MRDVPFVQHYGFFTASREAIGDGGADQPAAYHDGVKIRHGALGFHQFGLMPAALTTLPQRS